MVGEEVEVVQILEIIEKGVRVMAVNAETLGAHLDVDIGVGVDLGVNHADSMFDEEASVEDEEVEAEVVVEGDVKIYDWIVCDMMLNGNSILEIEETIYSKHLLKILSILKIRLYKLMHSYTATCKYFNDLQVYKMGLLRMKQENFYMLSIHFSNVLEFIDSTACKVDNQMRTVERIQKQILKTVSDLNRNLKEALDIIF